MGRASALLVLAALVGAYYGWVNDLPNAQLWWEVAWLAFIVIPAVTALVLCVLPASLLPPARLALITLGLIGVTILLGISGLHLLANFSKLGTAVFAGWLMATLAEELWLVVVVALVIPWFDAYSVWHGPTKAIVNHHKSVFSAFSFRFPVPHGETNLGLSDLFFFGFFLATALRFDLRVVPTWLALSLSFGGTMALAIWWDVSGLPALPLLSLGFLLPNAGLLWQRLRVRRLASG